MQSRAPIGIAAAVGVHAVRPENGLAFLRAGQVYDAILEVSEYLRNIALIVACPAGACSGQQARQLLATVCDAGPRVENDIVDVVRVQLLRSSGHIVVAADLQGGRLHVFVLGLLARHQLSFFPGFPTMFRSISSGGMLVRSFEISATTLSDTSLCRALRRSPMIIGGATITSWAYSPRFAAV